MRPSKAAFVLLLHLLAAAALLSCADASRTLLGRRPRRPPRPDPRLVDQVNHTLIFVYRPDAASDANIAAAIALLQALDGILKAEAVGAVVRIGDSFAAHSVQSAAFGSGDPSAVALAQLLAKNSTLPDLSGIIDVLVWAEVAQLRALGVDFVEADRIASIFLTESHAPWGLDRVDQRSLPLNSQFGYYDSAGAGSRIYVLDTGIRIDHVEFGGRAVWGISYTGVNTDDNGHGTHCAGIAAGSTYGIAKAATLVAVKVLDSTGSGSFSNIISGISWATSDCLAHTAAPRRCVLSMSLGGSLSTAINNAVASAYKSGMIVAVAAGNNAGDACQVSPASEGTAVTVMATDSNDRLATFSNYGKCTDVAAPGVSITSAWKTSPTATITISGTSMAAPHVAGAAALVWGQFTTATNQAVIAAIVNQATPGKLSFNSGFALSTSPNKLLFTSVTSI